MTTLSPDSVLTAVISLSLSWLLFPLENPENYLNYPESRGGFFNQRRAQLIWPIWERERKSVILDINKVNIK
jgi:hypothetical protein